MSFSSQPIIYPVSPSNTVRDRLRTLIQRAKTAVNHDESLRIAVIGDSTTTSPGGAGVGIHHHLYNRFGGLFGNVAGSQITPLGTTSSGAPWLTESHNNVRVIPFDTTYQPPGMVYGGLPFAGEGVYQPNLIFHSIGSKSYPYRSQVIGSSLFPSANISIELVGLKQSNSVDSVKVVWAPTDKRTNYVFATEVSSEDINMGLNAANGGVPEFTMQFRSALVTPATDFEPQWFFRSAEATDVGAGSKTSPGIAGVRVLNNNPVGCMIDCISAGGYRVVHWFGDPATGTESLRQNAAAPMAQLKHDMVFFAMGANDIYTTPPSTAAEIRADYYSPSGTNNKGLIGELIDAYEARNLTIPIIVLATNPYRARDNDAEWLASKKTEHDILVDSLVALADELQAAGYDTIVLNSYRYSHERGFTLELNDLNGLTDRGTYSTASVVYAVDDYYVGSDGKEYRCNLAHTSTTATEPVDVIGYHTPLKVHMLTNDAVHWSVDGSALMAEAYAYLFEQHFDEPSTQLSSFAMSQLSTAIGGVGARTVTLTIDDGVAVLANASVRMTKGAVSFIIATDILGVGVFSLDDGTWTVSITNDGYSFTPVTLVVSGTVNQTYSMTAVTVPTSSPSADQVTGYLYTYDEAGVIEVSVDVESRITKIPSSGTGIAYDTKTRTITSHGTTGLANFTKLWKGATYEFKRTGNSQAYQVTIPTTAGDPYELPSIMGSDE